MNASPYKNYVAGEWISSDAVTVNINPSDTNDVIGDYVQATVEHTERAVDAAFEAQKFWAACSAERRADALDRIGSEILIRSKELGHLLSREEGKTLAEGVGEATRAGRLFKFFAGEALRATGERLPAVRPGVQVETMREPEGVVGLITPWNFPLAIPAWKIAPALAFGNAVVFKPADLVPASAWALAEIIARVGEMPAGTFNLVMGRGSTVGQCMISSRKVRAISFTGSVQTGRSVGVACFQRGAKVQLEMGGKNPLIVLNDADLENAVSVAIQSAFYSTGQRCTAASRLIVEDGIHDAFVAAMAERMATLQVGHALNPDTQIGPAASQDQLDTDLRYIALGVEEGGRLVAGGEMLKRETPGFYLSPALLTETDNAMRLNREEVFGPVASVIRATDYEQAVEIANDSEFGLSSGICTTSLKYATDFKQRSASGMVMVNVATAGVDYHVPFGGRKGSSYGPREQGTYAREFYTSVKTAYTLA